MNAQHFAQISVTFNVSVRLVSQMDLRALASQTGISSSARGPAGLVLTAACWAVADQGEDGFRASWTCGHKRWAGLNPRP